MATVFFQVGFKKDFAGKYPDNWTEYQWDEKQGSMRDFAFYRMRDWYNASYPNGFPSDMDVMFIEVVYYKKGWPTHPNGFPMVCNAVTFTVKPTDRGK